MTDPRHIPLAISLTFPGQNNNLRPYRALACSPEGALWSMIGDPVTGNPIATVSIPANVTSGSSALVTAAGVYGKALQAGDDELQAVDSINLTPAGIAPAVTDLIGLACVSVPLLTDGSAFFAARGVTAASLAAQSGVGASLVSAPGEWSVNHTPVANTQATIGQAAVASTRHVCRSISANIIGESGAAATTVLLNLRDGATGAGTILWSQRLLVIASGVTGISISGLNIVGSVNTAMTLEFSAAGGANTFESVALTGFSVA